MSGLFLMLLVACSSAEMTDFDAGLAAVRGGDHPKAISHFVSALDTGGRHPATYHGLGNALYRDGHLGEAIAAWRRGMVLAPRNGDIAANLERAQKRLY